MNLKTKKLIFIFIFILVFGIIFQNSGFILAATFLEPFANTTNKDAANTTADWDTDNATGHLINGQWVQADNTTAPYPFEFFDEANGLAWPKVITDIGGQPVITFEDSNDNQIEIAKWTVGAGTGVCGGGETDCWTSMDGLTAGIQNNPLDLGGVLRTFGYNYVLLKLPDGTPIIAAEVFDDTDDFDLYYAQYTKGLGWTNADGTTLGIESVSNTSAKVADSTATDHYMDMKLDQYGQPSLIWNEVTGTGPYTIKFFYTRWNGSNWTYADRTTVGKQELVSISQAATPEMGVAFNYDSSGNIYYAVKSDNTVGTMYMMKWNGSNWTNLAGTALSPLPATSYSQLTYINTGFNMHIDFDSADTLYFAHGGFIRIGKWVSGTWKHMDGVTNGFEDATSGVPGLGLQDFSIDDNNNVLIWGYTVDEVYFTQWNGSDWVYSDGTTSGAEQISNLTSGSKIDNLISSSIDEYDYPVIVYSDYVSLKALPIYFTRFTGSDTKGGDKITNDQDTLIGSAQTSQDPHYSYVYYDQNTKDIHVVLDTATGNMFYTKLNNSRYPNSPQVLQSDTIATPYTGSITSATLTATDLQPAGTTITYYMSADGGSNWEAVTSGVPHNFTNTGSDLRWKANLTSSSAGSSPQIEYLLVDVDANVEGSAGQVTITANVDPSLTFNISSANCQMGEFSLTSIKTCNFYTDVDTNASSGYIAFVKEDGDLRNATNSITNVSDNEVTATYEEYGIATSDTDYASLDINQQVTDCASLDGSSSVAAVALTTSDQSFAIANSPVNTDTVYLCISAAIAASTPAGAYSNIVTITVVGNF